jgi:hypothetical protein
MSRFILGDCVQVMSRFPARAVDFILTDPPYLVGYKDRNGRTLAGDNSAEWLQPACHEMYRVLKNDSLMVSFYAWNRADLFLNAWKSAGFLPGLNRLLRRRRPGQKRASIHLLNPQNGRVCPVSQYHKRLTR